MQTNRDLWILAALVGLAFASVATSGCVDPETGNGADAGSERPGGAGGIGGQGGGSGGPDQPGDSPGSGGAAGAEGGATDLAGGDKDGSGGGGGAGGGGSGFNPPCPRLGAYPISSPHSYDKPATQAHWAKYHVVIFGQWPGWEKGRLLTMAESVEAVKKLSPHVPPTRVFEYVNNNEQDPGVTVKGTLIKKLDTMGWWLYKTGASGARVPGTYNPSWLIINNTVLGPVDAAGKNSVVWMADWYKSWNVDGAEGTAPNPHWDGFFLDNVFWRPRVDGDWNRDGMTDPKTDPATQKRLREGQKAWVDRLRDTWPGSLQLGNIADWPQASAADDPAAIAPMSGVLDGGVMEGLIGETWSVENRGFAEMMRYYRYMLDNTRAPRLVIFGDRPGSYQNLRYGLGACLMDDAYYYPAEDGYNPDSRLWYDEFDNAGAGMGYLGHPIEPRRSAAWSKGGVAPRVRQGDRPRQPERQRNPDGGPRRDLQEDRRQTGTFREQRRLGHERHASRPRRPHPDQAVRRIHAHVRRRKVRSGIRASRGRAHRRVRVRRERKHGLGRNGRRTGRCR